MAAFFLTIQIRLTEGDLERAHSEAQRRQDYNQARNLKGRNRAAATGDEALRLHILGCVGELAVAKYLGMESRVFDAQGPIRGSSDLPGNIEVKTRPKANYDLLVQFGDDPNKIFVLVTHEGGESAHVRGWIRGKDAMRKEYVRELVRGRPCYVIPQKALESPQTLLVAMHGNAAQRVLQSHEVWITEQDGELVLHFCDALADALGWSVGTVLEWDIMDESTCVIRPIREQPPQES